MRTTSGHSPAALGAVQTKNGTVYLHGMVETTAERRDLESIAKHTTGVKKVVNETSVSKGGS